ncbi:MAG: response regulator [Cyclobacteriaceae bacterium]|nr:response regulator [Cyclobacteriaceae bacterium HetDA_MAG_MS6]
MKNSGDLYRVLYVDDEFYNLVTFKAVFRKKFDILTASSGEEALPLLGERKIDLVITDFKMPKMTGLELLKKVKEKYPGIPGIVLTGYVDSVVKSKKRPDTLVQVVSKPWEEDNLAGVIRNALKSAS